MDQISKVIEPSRQFAKDSLRLVKRCTKPDRKGTLMSSDNSCNYPFIRVLIVLLLCSHIS